MTEQKEKGHSGRMVIARQIVTAIIFVMGLAALFLFGLRIWIDSL